jgi:hypothetical protein
MTKTYNFGLIFEAEQRIFVTLQIRDREINLRLILHPFCIHHFIVPSIPIDLIATINLTLKMRSKSGKFQAQLNIWHFIVPEINVYKKASKFHVNLLFICGFAM